MPAWQEYQAEGPKERMMGHTAIFERKSGGNGLRYSDIERNVLLYLM
jgi:hypothetical protein